MNRSARRLRWGILLIGAAVVAVVAWTGHQALNARAAFDRLTADLTQIQDDLSSGDVEGASQAVSVAQGDAATAYSNTRGPVWWLGTRVPGIGQNVAAVRTVAEVSNEVTHQILPLVVHAGQALQPSSLSPHDGRIDLAPVQGAVDDITRVADLLGEQVTVVDGIDPAGLDPSLSGPVTDLQEKLAKAYDYAHRASVAMKLMPGMLGASGPRSYLLLVENNAELRSSGGIAGFLAQINVQDGKVTMGDYASSRTFGTLSHRILPTTQEENAIFGPRFALFVQNITATPDFPRTAQLAQAVWEQHMGVNVDGVISADPVALSYLLQGTGPVTTPDGVKVTADDAVKLLLSQTYITHPDPDAQDAFFVGVAQAVFNALASGQGSARQSLDGLVQASDEGRLHVWSSHSDEESILETTALGGAMPTTSDGHPQVGVYFDESTASKLDYYLKYQVSLTGVSCTAGQQDLSLQIELTNTLSQDPAKLPAYVVGLPGGIVRPGTLLATIYTYGPLGGELKSATLDGGPGPVNYLSSGERPVGAQTLSLQPGQTRRVTFDVVGAPGDLLDPQLSVTPGARGTGLGTVDPSLCH